MHSTALRRSAHSPAIVGPQSAVEGGGDVPEAVGGALEALGEVGGVALGQLHHAAYHDDEDGQQLGRSEDVLDTRRQVHRVRVDERDEDYGGERGGREAGVSLV